PRPRGAAARQAAGSGWQGVADRRPVAAMWLTGLLLMLANMSIEPIITVYVAQLVHEAAHVTMVAGVVMSAGALGSILSAARLGRLADRIGHWNVTVACLGAAALLLVPQAFVSAGWQLVLLRFLMGLALGGLLPCIAAVIRHSVPDGTAGRMLGWSVSAQYAGQVAGPLIGGWIGGHAGMRWVFLGTSVLMAAGALGNAAVQRAVRGAQAKAAK
ncbi:MAG: MFS transporter, partial [Xenophilus sp.]